MSRRVGEEGRSGLNLREPPHISVSIITTNDTLNSVMFNDRLQFIDDSYEGIVRQPLAIALQSSLVDSEDSIF